MIADIYAALREFLNWMLQGVISNVADGTGKDGIKLHSRQLTGSNNASSRHRGAGRN